MKILSYLQAELALLKVINGLAPMLFKLRGR